MQFPSAAREKGVIPDSLPLSGFFLSGAITFRNNPTAIKESGIVISCTFVGVAAHSDPRSGDREDSALV